MSPPSTILIKEILTGGIYMPFITRHESGAIVFNLTEDEQSVRDLKEEMQKELEEIRALKEEMKKSNK